MTAQRSRLTAVLLASLPLRVVHSRQANIDEATWNPKCGSEDECYRDESERFDLDDPVAQRRNGYPSVYPNGRYDVWKCPDEPPAGYPYQWKAVDVLENWNPDDAKIPSAIYQGLCVFDFSDSYQIAMKYLEADVPFMMVNTPDFLEASRRWNNPHYVENLLGNETTYPLYTSPSNQFLYWRRLESPPSGWKSPTEYSRVTYQQFQRLKEKNALPNEAHHYMYAEGHWSASDKNHRWELFDEFPRFKPGNTDLYHELFHQDYQTLYFKFGMQGNTAVMHFDQQRNTIVMIKGKRRYLLADPTQCPELFLHDKRHPSSRHTTLDLRSFPKDNGGLMNEVVLQAGDALILPSFWFHSVIGLTSEDMQVNAWSTATANRKPVIQECGNFV